MTSSPHRFGHIHDDLQAVGSAIYQATFAATTAVWIDDAGAVRGAERAAPEAVPAHWIAGTFAAGTTVAEIVDDLRAVMRERSKDWIID
jgi:hypothetical protein